jgi:hypothetical protein
MLVKNYGLNMHIRVVGDTQQIPYLVQMRSNNSLQYSTQTHRRFIISLVADLQACRPNVCRLKICYFIR